ncbi:hypothetical protein [Maribacter flavus]|uniref:YopA central domain-containing protein n=1 Tax=Maribacter flavus TaxID=1658664 RepID=A0A5B2TXY4_9FLAO|nr:hypothetical protein [Maribacter flavus]KAA2218510.1 hypothetical protein F0361_02495 [Maribacter flavus]
MDDSNFMDEFSDTPNALADGVSMKEANESIDMYNGLFSIKYEETALELIGNLIFQWNPSPKVVFKGASDNSRDQFEKILGTKKPFEIFIDGLLFGQGRFTMIKDSIIEGEVYSEAIIGDKSVEVDELRFQIPNLRRFHGDTIKLESETYISTWNGRLVFDSKDYMITIDQRHKYSKLRDELKSKGGYVLMYNGMLLSKKGSISYQKAKELMFCFSMFLSFLNGRRVSCMFLKGLYETETKWTDYGPNLNDPYKYVVTWSTQFNTDGFNDLWLNFYKIWFELNEKSFLVNAIKWYLEANCSSTSSDTRTIMAQATLELIFNWWIVEQLKILSPGRDIENLSASNKFRIILAQSRIPYLVPAKYDGLVELVQKENGLTDGPDAIVSIRNSLVHSQSKKRKMINELPVHARYEAIPLALWYIELSLLNLLGYSGIYHNRVANNRYIHESEEYVPWVIRVKKTKIKNGDAFNH